MTVYELPDDPRVTDVDPAYAACPRCGALVEALNETLAAFFLDAHVEREHGSEPGWSP